MAYRSHKHKRFNRYTGDVGSRRRRRGGFQPWYLIPICAAVAFLVTLLLGSVLGNIADNSIEGNEPDSIPSQSPTRPPATAVSIDEVDAIFVGLEGIYDNTYAEVSKQIPDGTRAISLSMFDTDGTPLYKSDVAIEENKACGELTLKNIFRYSNENGIYTSVPFPVSSLLMEKGLSASYTAAYEIEMIRELCEAGASEIIVKCDSSRLSDEAFVDRVIAYLCEIQIKVPDINVGFMISAADASSEDTKGAIDVICDYADVCAVDMTSAKNAEELSSLADAAIVNILRYKMRVLIRYGSEDEAITNYAALDSFGIKNRQVIVK